jgi:hypothetical protein
VDVLILKEKKICGETLMLEVLSSCSGVGYCRSSVYQVRIVVVKIGLFGIIRPFYNINWFLKSTQFCIIKAFLGCEAVF